jgi:predicted MFS family arabinose efflux permease
VRPLVRIARLIWGEDVDQALRPLLAVTLTASLANSAVWVFVGIWAIKDLGATQAQLGAGYLVSALLAGCGGYAGGHLSDHLGRRPLILTGWAGLAISPLGFLAAGDNVFLGLALIAAIGLVGSIGHGADAAMVADLVPAERREQAYAAVRVAQNLGVTLGPPVGGALLLGGSWRVFFVGAAALGALAWVVAFLFLPQRGAYAPEEPPTRGSFGAIRRDRAFLVFMGSSILASMTYVAYETLLPISLTTSHGLEPAAWGFLLIVNPLMVTFFQLRLTRRVAHVPAAVKLAVAMPLMGLPFLLLGVSSAIPVIVLVLFLFVIGEMLWIPTSQSVVAAFAPLDLRGAYMGAFTSSWSVAWALGPFSGLQVRDAFGDSTVWMCVAVVSLLAATAGAAAVRGREVRAEPAVASAS